MNKKLVLLSSIFLINLNAIEVSHLEVPNEFSVDIFTKEVISPRQMAEGSNGYIFVGSKIGNVYAFEITMGMARLIVLLLLLRV